MLGEEEHSENNADGKHDGDNNRKFIEILLHNAGSSAGVVQGAGDHVGYAGALPECIKTRAISAIAESAQTAKEKESGTDPH